MELNNSLSHPVFLCAGLCDVFDSCSSVPCQNQATCLRMGNSDFRCVCEQGYYGALQYRAAVITLLTGAPRQSANLKIPSTLGVEVPLKERYTLSDNTHAPTFDINSGHTNERILHA